MRHNYNVYEKQLFLSCHFLSKADELDTVISSTSSSAAHYTNSSSCQQKLRSRRMRSPAVHFPGSLPLNMM